MNTAEARVDEATLDALALLPQPLDQFRLLPGCATCLQMMELPATQEGNTEIREHALQDHRDRLLDD